MIMRARDGRNDHLTLGGLGLAALVAGALLLAGLCGAALQRYTAPVVPASYGVDWPSYARSTNSQRDADFVRENVNLLASKVGTLEAKLLSIDGLGRRVAQIAGVEFTDPELSAQIDGMPKEASQVMDDLFTDRQPPSAESAEALGRQLDEIQERLTQQSDNLKMLDAALTRRSADQARLPTSMPVSEEFPFLSSSYGWRRNPVTGRYAMHEGLDFAAPNGTPIVAASGGVVLEAKFQSGYGNMVEVDHGDGLITRYAHASRLLVKPGELVERGQPLALVGSTGRSTGAHLHFEVRLTGQPLDPRLFLVGKQSKPPAVAAAPAPSSAAQ